MSLEAQMPDIPARQALEQARSIAFLREFYASLGMRKVTVERAIQHGKGLSLAPSTPVMRRRPGRPRRK
jgi:hypothetical protein